MSIKYIAYLIAGVFLSLSIHSCNSSDEPITYSSQTNDAQIYSFSLTGSFYKFEDPTERAIDSIRFVQVNKTRYAIDQVRRIIYNPDSLPYGTVLRNKVFVSATYNPVFGASSVNVVTPDSIGGFYWNNTDSLNFSKQPISFTVTALAGDTRRYDIDIRIHKVDPDLMVWNEMNSIPTTIGQSKTLLVDNSTFYTYSVKAGSVSLFTADRTSLNWMERSVSGLPATVKLESIFNMNGIFYSVLENGDSYKSADGLSWSQVANNRIITSIVGVLPSENRLADHLLLTVNKGGQFYFAKTTDMLSIEDVERLSFSPSNNQVPSSFPVRGFASLTNYSSDKNNRMLILDGGANSQGQDVDNTWFVKNTSNGLEMVPSAKHNLFKGEGLSNAIYDGNLYVLSQNQFYISNTWGSSWYKASDKQNTDPSMIKRSKQTMIVDNDNYIWIFGGVSDNGTYLNDVWRGRMNKLSKN